MSTWALAWGTGLLHGPLLVLSCSSKATCFDVGFSEMVVLAEEVDRVLVAAAVVIKDFGAEMIEVVPVWEGWCGVVMESGARGGRLLPVLTVVVSTWVWDAV